MKCCNQQCNQGRTCPARKPTKTTGTLVAIALAAALSGIAVTCAIAQTSQEAACLNAQRFAVVAMKSRHDGATMDDAMASLRAHKIYSGPIARAVKTAFKVPADTSNTYLEILVWGECMEAARK